jgi:hypothetical protein
MKVVCAWCRTTLREDSEHQGPLSHGICDECGYTFLHERGIGLRRLLQGTAVPVIVVNRDREIQEDVQGTARKIGRVIGCANAKCCGGCGSSKNCGPCDLRDAITRTHADGVPRYGEISEHPLRSQGDRTLILRFSTSRIAQEVLVVFEQRSLETCGAG